MGENVGDTHLLEDIRMKSRQHRKQVRGEKRDSILSSKRLHLSEIQPEFEKISDDQIRELSHHVSKRSKDRIVLQKLKHAFILDDSKKEIFLRTNGAIHGLVGLLTGNDISLRLEALGCIINLLTAHHRMVKSLVRETVPYLISYLHSGGAQVQELAAWALGNVAADCAECCAMLKSQHFIQGILPLLRGNHDWQITYCALFALRCYMQNVLQDWREILDSGLEESLAVLLKYEGEVLQETTHILFFLSSCSEYDNCLLSSGCFQAVSNHLCRIIALSAPNNYPVISDKECKIVAFLIRILAGLTSEKEIAARIVLQTKGFNETVERLLSCNYIHIQKEVLWLLANLAGHTIEEISTIFASNSILDSISKKLFGPPCVVIESLICLCNLVGSTNGHVSQVASAYVSYSVLQCLLSSSNPGIVFNTLVLASLILRREQSESLPREKNDFLMIVRHLVTSTDSNIRSQALTFLQCMDGSES